VLCAAAIRERQTQLPPVLVPKLGRVKDEEPAVEAHHYVHYSIVRYSEQWNNGFIGSETGIIDSDRDLAE
jgi:hypothetical protein